MTLFSENWYPYGGFHYRLQQDGNWFKIYLSQLLYKKDFPQDKGNQEDKTILLAAQFAQRPALNWLNPCRHKRYTIFTLSYVFYTATYLSGV